MLEGPAGARPRGGQAETESVAGQPPDPGRTVVDHSHPAASTLGPASAGLLLPRNDNSYRITPE